MHRSKEQLYQEIKDIKSKDEFEKEIDKIQEEYDRLLDEDTAALLIVDKLGRNKQNISKINELEPRDDLEILYVEYIDTMLENDGGVVPYQLIKKMIEDGMKWRTRWNWVLDIISVLDSLKKNGWDKNLYGRRNLHDFCVDYLRYKYNIHIDKLLGGEYVGRKRQKILDRARAKGFLPRDKKSKRFFNF